MNNFRIVLIGLISTLGLIFNNLCRSVYYVHSFKQERTDKKTGYISIVAAARKLAELMYTLLKNGTSYEKRASASVKQLAAEALATAS